MADKRSIAAVTVARSDFGLYEPLLEKIKADAALELRLLVSGAHFAPEFGPTVREIEDKGYDYERGLDMPRDSDSPQSIASSLGGGVQAFAKAFGTKRPDLLLVLGDRLEMVCAPIAALPFNIPVAHLYGGKVSEGAVDELVRHALTKMSHLHFVTSETHARRVLQMGEESWRVMNYGSPGLDRLYTRPRTPRGEVYARLSFDSAQPFLLVTFHPVTLEPLQRDAQVSALLAALAQYDGQIVLTYPNADVGHAAIIAAFEAFAAPRSARVRLLKNAGAGFYFDLMACATAMIGNTSSGIGDAPSFELPVVNIGTRQAGFERAINVIDVGYDTAGIDAAIRRATSTEFRAGLRGLVNPYGDGKSSARIAEALRSIPLDDRLLRKKFVDRLVPQ